MVKAAAADTADSDDHEFFHRFRFVLFILAFW